MFVPRLFTLLKCSLAKVCKIQTNSQTSRIYETKLENSGLHSSPSAKLVVRPCNVAVNSQHLFGILRGQRPLLRPFLKLTSCNRFDVTWFQVNGKFCITQ